MTTQMRKQVSGTARVAFVGVLSLVAMGAWAQNAGAQTKDAPALMGQIEVTARALHVAASTDRSVPEIASVPVIGQMIVTATRLASLAQRSKQPASAGEPAVRSRSPRAVLVQ